MTEKDDQRAKINRDIAQYLASGKSIDAIDQAVSQASRQPAKRTRNEQIDYLKRTTRAT